MKISYNWLKKLINLDESPEVIAEHLTHCGLEVESIEKFESVKGGLKGMVIGKVIHKEKHPDADRLSITKVDIGTNEALNIVCGAPNVAEGQKVVIATIGAKLFPSEGDPFEIKKSKIRGALSEGMICAEDEIGLGKSHEGIMVLDAHAEIGMEASAYFNIETDFIFEIGLTPNRSDAASHLGVARDLAAVLNCKFNTEKYQLNYTAQTEFPIPSGILETKIELTTPELCKRYSGVTISGIEVKESPEWLKTRLKSIGLKPINNIVDITNYVLHETGQPLHAFDAFAIKDHTLYVRTAAIEKDGKTHTFEKFTTLDGIERKLQGSELMICDSEKPLCMAGIFGGINSGINEKTSAVFVESAYFDAGSIRKSSKLHGLKTDASFRFERGTDPNMVPYALHMAIQLILEIAGGQLSSDIIDLYPSKIESKKVAFSFVNCNRLTGKELDRNIVKKIITSLGIHVHTEGSDGLLLEVPPFKTDVSREADVIEEVMRVYGYNQIEEASKIAYTYTPREKNNAFSLENKLASYLSSGGFTEIMGTSLSSGSYYNENETNLVKMLNPLSQDLNILRKTMLYSALEALKYNLNRKNLNLKFFEFGKTYQITASHDFKFSETKCLSLALCGNQFTENHYLKNQPVSFYTLKNAVEQLLSLSGIKNYTFSNCELKCYVNGLSVEYLTEKNEKIQLGHFGEVSNESLKLFDIDEPVMFAELNTDNMSIAIGKQKLVFKSVSKFPSVRRDLALLLDASISYQEIEKSAFETEKKLLKEISIFDVYKGDKISNGKKSYAIAFHLLNEEATLTDKQIDAVMEKLIKNFKDKLGAELRS